MPYRRHVTSVTCGVVLLLVALSYAELETRAAEVEATTATDQSLDRKPDTGTRNSGTGTRDPETRNPERRKVSFGRSTAEGNPRRRRPLTSKRNIHRDDVSGKFAQSPIRSRDTTTHVGGEPLARQRHAYDVTVTSTDSGDLESNLLANSGSTGSEIPEAISERSRPIGSSLPRRSRHLGSVVRPLLASEPKPSGYGADEDVPDDPEDDVTLPEDDDVLRAVLGIAKCRAICPNQVSKGICCGSCA